jgi:hypothetical protein
VYYEELRGVNLVDYTVKINLLNRNFVA